MGVGICQWDWGGCNITVTLQPPGGLLRFLFALWQGVGPREARGEAFSLRAPGAPRPRTLRLLFV